jgi:hypothetical protein
MTLQCIDSGVLIKLELPISSHSIKTTLSCDDVIMTVIRNRFTVIASKRDDIKIYTQQISEHEKPTL